MIISFRKTKRKEGVGGKETESDGRTDTAARQTLAIDDIVEGPEERTGSADDEAAHHTRQNQGHFDVHRKN